MKSSYLTEIKIIITLAIPIMIAQIAQTAVAFVDTMMAGRYSAVDLSGVAIGASLWFPSIYFGHGLLAILTPIIANLNGATKRDQIANQTRQGLWIAGTVSLLIMLILYNSEHIIQLRNFNNSIDPELIRIASGYLKAMMFGVPAYLFFLVYRNQCEGLSNTKPAMIISVCALFVNIPVNYVFIYGKLGLPALGGVGCGVAGAIIYWIMFALMKWYTKTTSSQRDIRKTTNLPLIDFVTIKRIIFLGLPLAFALVFETSLFAIISLLIAPLGVIAVASHQIIFTLGSLTFTIPLAFSVAVGIRISYLLGKKQIKQAQYICYFSLIVAFMFSIVTAITIVLNKTWLINLFTSDPSILQLASQLIILLAIYQCSDYLQLTATSILRAYKDTKSIFIITFIAYWIIALPIGYTLSLTDKLLNKPLGPAGFWIGIIIGLSSAAILLLSRMYWIQRQSEEQILKLTSR